MDIGVVVHYFDANEGTGGYTVELVSRLAREHRVTLYAAGVRTPPPDGVRVVTVPAMRGRAYATILTFPSALASVRGSHDLVHAQGWVAAQADVVTAHYVLAAWRPLARAHGVRSAWGERLFGWLVERRERDLFRNHCRTIIAPSAGVRRDIERYYGRREGVVVIPHGFRTAPPGLTREAARRQLGVPDDRLVALWIGDTRKGLGTALQAVAQTPAVELLVATRTPAAPFLARAAALGMAERVRWAGYLSDPWPAYVASDLLLYPTIYEPFGLVIAEAMAAGLPPVVTRAAGAADLLRHGASGWLLERPTVEETVRGLQALAKDSGLRARLGAGARAVAAERTWDRVAEETVAAYEAARRR